MEITTIEQARKQGAADARKWYGSETRPLWVDADEIRIGEGHTIAPYTGFSQSEIEASYRTYFIGVWNALRGQDEASVFFGQSPLREDWGEVEDIGEDTAYCEACRTRHPVDAMAAGAEGEYLCHECQTAI